MKAVVRGWALAWCVALALSVNAKDGRPAQHETRPIDLQRLTDGRTDPADGGRITPGLDLKAFCRPRFIIGDDSTYATRELIDTAWTALQGDRSLDTAGVIWIRYHLNIDPELRGVPLQLGLSTTGAVQVYVNGQRLAASEGPAMLVKGDMGLQVSFDRNLALPIVFAYDGPTEVIAIRFVRGEVSPTLHVTLRLADSGSLMRRDVLHFGLFIGVNLLIFLLALVIHSLDRKEPGWLPLAWLSLVTAVAAFSDIASDVDLGLGLRAVQALAVLQVVLIPWPMFLLIQVLRQLGGAPTRRWTRIYTITAILMTLLGFGFAAMGMAQSGEGDASPIHALIRKPMLLIAVALMAFLFGLLVLGMTIEIVRHSVRLIRTMGVGRLIGVGALVSIVLAFVLQMAAAFAGATGSTVMGIIAQYCSYVALPVAVAIYLAVRSARNNKLVARQRDDLDLEVQERTAELREEKERSDQLLLNILPSDVAEELKRNGSAEAKHFDSATILFTDFKDFTATSERLTPQELVQELNTCFKAFDHIVSARHIEKIKTIGDAYMCAGGLPDPRSATPADVVHAALEMQAFMQQRMAERQAQGLPLFGMRVGIHTGPVVAGIVGVKKFQYDIWGDTVNTASRMESTGEVGRVNISQHTYALVKDEPGLRFTPRGKVSAKGKGELEMYYVERG